MKSWKSVLPRALIAVLCVLFAAVWLYAGLFGDTTVLGRTALWARLADVLFGLTLLSGSVIWAIRAAKAGRRKGEQHGTDKGT